MRSIAAVGELSRPRPVAAATMAASAACTLLNGDRYEACI